MLLLQLGVHLVEGVLQHSSKLTLQLLHLALVSSGLQGWYQTVDMTACGLQLQPAIAAMLLP